MLGSLAQPILFLIALGFGFGPVFSKAGEGNYLQFLTPGIIAMSILFSATFSGIEVIWDRQFGFLKETLVAPVSRLKIMIGRTLGGATIATIQGFIVFLLSLLVGFRPQSIFAIFVSLIFMFLIALIFTAVGTIIASFMDDFHGFQIIMNFLIMPLFFLSGAIFPLKSLPKLISIISSFNPLSYGVDGVRGVLTGLNHFNLYQDFTILSIIAIIFITLGACSFSKIQV